MSMAARSPGGLPSVREVVSGLPGWLASHLPTAAVSAVAGGALGFVVNVWLMAARYDGWQKVPSGAPATGKGNLLQGGLFWALASALIFAIIGYWRAVRNRVANLELIGAEFTDPQRRQ